MHNHNVKNSITMSRTRLTVSYIGIVVACGAMFTFGLMIGGHLYTCPETQIPPTAETAERVPPIPETPPESGAPTAPQRVAMEPATPSATTPPAPIMAAETPPAQPTVPAAPPATPPAPTPVPPTSATPAVPSRVNAAPAPVVTPPAVKPETKPEVRADWTVQISAYGATEAAEKRRDEVGVIDGFKPYITTTRANDGSIKYRVRIGAFATREEALRFQKQVEDKLKSPTMVTRYAQ